MKVRSMVALAIVIIAIIFAADILLAGEADSLRIKEPANKNCVSLGILQGGGALIGADYERLLVKNIGVQVGAGLTGFGAAVNFHFKPSVSSPAISLCYWNQGTSGELLSQRALGVTYLYRSVKGLTAQIGLGYLLEVGKLMEDYYEDHGVENPPDVLLLYSLGWTFKF